MISKREVLIDSDAFVGYFYPDDPHHEKVQRIFAELERKSIGTVATSLVIVETATVLSHRDSQGCARTFLEVIESSKLPIIHITEELQQSAFDLFKAQTVKNTSVVDCSNVTVMRLYHIPAIFSFDKFYRNHPDIQTTDLIGLV